MTNSPLLGRKINAYIKNISSASSKQVSFVVIDKVGDIIEFLEVVPSIPFGAITFPMDQIFDRTAFSPLDNSFIEKSFYLKGLNGIDIAFYKDRKGSKRNGLENKSWVRGKGGSS